jgi:hypothetical protein
MRHHCDSGGGVNRRLPLVHCFDQFGRAVRDDLLCFAICGCATKPGMFCGNVARFFTGFNFRRIRRKFFFTLVVIRFDIGSHALPGCLAAPR